MRSKVPRSRIVDPLETAPEGRKDKIWWISWRNEKGYCSGEFTCMELDEMLRVLSARDYKRARYYGVDIGDLETHQWRILTWWANSWGLDWGNEEEMRLWLLTHRRFYSDNDLYVMGSEWCSWRETKWNSTFDREARITSY